MPTRMNTKNLDDFDSDFDSATYVMTSTPCPSFRERPRVALFDP